MSTAFQAPHAQHMFQRVAFPVVLTRDIDMLFVPVGQNELNVACPRKRGKTSKKPRPLLGQSSLSSVHVGRANSFGLLLFLFLIPGRGWATRVFSHFMHMSEWRDTWTREETGMSPSPGLEKDWRCFSEPASLVARNSLEEQSQKEGIELGFPAQRGEKHGRPWRWSPGNTAYVSCKPSPKRLFTCISLHLGLKAPPKWGSTAVVLSSAVSQLRDHGNFTQRLPASVSSTMKQAEEHAFMPEAVLDISPHNKTPTQCQTHPWHSINTNSTSFSHENLSQLLTKTWGIQMQNCRQTPHGTVKMGKNKNAHQFTAKATDLYDFT